MQKILYNYDIYKYDDKCHGKSWGEKDLLQQVVEIVMALIDSEVILNINIYSIFFFLLNIKYKYIS